MEDLNVGQKESKDDAAAFQQKASACAQSAKDFFRRLVLFVCCGPGVLGFLWLIGRILKR